MKKKIKRHFVIQEFDDDSYAIREFKNGSIWPAIYKPNARETIARLMQLMNVGPVAPQTEPERIELK